MHSAEGSGRYRVPLFIVVATLVLSASPTRASAEARVVEQTLMTASIEQPSGQAYPVQTFTAPTTTTITSYAVANDNACGGTITDGAFAHGTFPVRTAIPGGWRYSGGSYPVVAGNVYYLYEGCNNNPGFYRGTTQDSYAGGEAGGYVKTNFFLPAIFIPNAARNNPLLDWAFTICTSDDCSLMPAAPPAPTSTPPCAVDCFSNVLFLPGIEASRLYRPEPSVPGGILRLWEPGSDASAFDLAMNPDGSSIRPDIFTRDVLDNAYVPIKGNVYKSFISDMSNLVATGKINAWVPAPYDWRLTLDEILSKGTKTGDAISYLNATDSPYILQELTRLAATSKSGKVTIIAHSNGGLVAKALMQRIGAASTSALVDKVIFVAVPQVGTPQALAIMLHGYDQGLPLHSFQLYLSAATTRAIGDTMPGLYNLLPSEAYFTYVDDPVATFSSSTLPDWFAKYGDVIHSAERQHAFLTDATRIQPLLSDLVNPTTLSNPHLSQAEAVHAALDSWTPPAGVRLIQIAGWGNPATVAGIDYKRTQRKDGSQFVEGVPRFVVDGDGTVVVPSALWVSTSTGAEDYWVDLDTYSHAHPFVTVLGFSPYNHGSIFEVKPVRDLLGDMMINSAKPISDYEVLSKIAPASTALRLRFSLHSPLTLNLFDNAGRHTGISTTTGQFEENIPGTYYAEFGDVKYLFTDASSSAHIMMRGYATSTFTFQVEQLVGNTRVASTTWQDMPVSPSTSVGIDVQSDIATLSSLRIDKNGDGIADYILAPKANDIVTLPKPALTVAAVNKNILVGGAMPAFDATLSGFLDGDTASTSVSGAPLCSTTATTTGVVGTFPITCVVGTLTSSKYAFTTFVAGTLAILYRWDGFAQPINDTAHQVGQSASVFKAGSTVPVKFQLKNAAGASIQASTLPIWLAPQKGAAMSASVDETIYSDPGTSGTAYRWDSASQQYVYNWSTKGLAAGYWYRIFAKLDDGTTQSVIIGLR